MPEILFETVVHSFVMLFVIIDPVIDLERYPTKLNQCDGGKSVFRAGAA